MQSSSKSTRTSSTSTSPAWDARTRLLACVNRGIFFLAGAALVSGTLPAYLQKEQTLQLVLQNEGMPSDAWSRLGQWDGGKAWTSDAKTGVQRLEAASINGSTWQNFILYY